LCGEARGVDLRDVRTFSTVVDAGRFQAAAEDLRITQQAVSKRIAVLERGLGVALAAALDGSIDTTFRRLIAPGARLPDALRGEHVIDYRHQLPVGPRHTLADAASVALAELWVYPAWMLGMREDTEWGPTTPH
jgi:hypothetical protein